ncbi:MAG TPA: penicillin-binding transpeptidase domain-containing protein, partial [Chitinivibrionales bacterium]
DADIQKITENALKQAVENLKACGGMCIIMEPATGKILAMAGEPSFNPNFAVRYSLGQRLNKCINYTYEPGSTFKVLTAACALQERVLKETDTLDGNHGFYEVFDQKIRDKEAFGRLSFTEAFKYSSNVCFAKIANTIGNQRLYTYVKNFGFGAQTGIALPGEEIGIVRPIDKWSGRSRVTMAIGQEISVTLLQMSLLFAAAANGGVLVEPCMVEKIVEADGVTADSARYKPLRRVIEAETAARIRAMMCEVVNSGTGKKAAIKGIAVAGKTGTSQKIDKTSGSYSDKRAWASFIGFLPADNPLLLGAVVIDEPANAEMGGAAAAPVFQKIMSQIISHPQLEYAEKIIKQNPRPLASDSVKSRWVPDLRSMPVENAVGLLASERLPYELIGDKKGIIAYQSPQAGAALGADTKIRVYSQPVLSSEKSSVAVPQCVGKDLRDAINAVNLKGLTPCARGAGVVFDQSPRAGVLVTIAEACTLFCSYGNIVLSSAQLRQR